MNKISPDNFKDCFIMDKSELNPVPRTWIGKFLHCSFSSRYSMGVYMRLAQYYYKKSQNSNNKITRKIYSLIQCYFTRKNQINNNFEVSPFCQVWGGWSFTILVFVLPHPQL